MKLVLVLLGLFVQMACNRGTPAPHAAPASEAAQIRAAATDTLPISGADPAVRPAFLAARKQGVRAGLDSLTALAARDEGLRMRGHELAHALGRFAMSEWRDLAVLRECTPVFQSGCFHGAMEGFFLHGGTVDRASVGGICGARPEPGRPGYERLECWHGLGHGLMVRFGGDIGQVLPLCDVLQTPTGRRECQDGAFMERAIRAVGAESVNAGEGPAMGHHGSHGGGAKDGHGSHGGDPAPSSSAPLSHAELQRLCGAIDARYQPSCWAYQPIALLLVHGMAPAAVLDACDQAPAAAVRDCYQGFGKQYLGAMDGDAGAMIDACRQGNRAYVADCLLGGVEYFTDLEWTIEPGIAFCAQVPADAKTRCYGLIGRRLGLIHPEPRRAAAACRRVEAAFVLACLAGLRDG
ncbi:MAG TPA: hypothetical protein VHG08_03450 [Longimicrobium sp.]|nr:hypothetical protein [Longimicrobium sp.]